MIILSTLISQFSSFSSSSSSLRCLIWFLIVVRKHRHTRAQTVFCNIASRQDNFYCQHWNETGTFSCSRSRPRFSLKILQLLTASAAARRHHSQNVRILVSVSAQFFVFANLINWCFSACQWMCIVSHTVRWKEIKHHPNKVNTSSTASAYTDTLRSTQFFRTTTTTTNKKT